MRNRALLAPCLLFLMLLTGCGVGANPFTAPDLTGNWQIQSGTTLTGSVLSANAVILLGALKSNGANVTGTFRFSNFAHLGCDFDQVTTVNGAIDSKNNLTLTSATLKSGGVIKISLTVIPGSSNLSAGTIAVTGGSCPYASSAAIGVEVPSVTGTYTGTLEPGTPANPGTSGGGPAKLVITQSTTPAADGQFPVTGTFTLSSAACSVNTPVYGDISGIGLGLSNVAPGEAIPTSVNLIVTDTPSGTPLSVQELLLVPTLCSTSSTFQIDFTGPLTKQ